MIIFIFCYYYRSFKENPDKENVPTVFSEKFMKIDTTLKTKSILRLLKIDTNSLKFVRRIYIATRLENKFCLN